MAQHLALALGYDWVDAPMSRPNSAAGRSIASIFADHGEAAFRHLESLMLAELVRRERVVLALGEALVLGEEKSKTTARRAGTVVWLTADPERRFTSGCSPDHPTSAACRPPLTSSAGLDEIERLLAERTPLYRECANLVIDTVGKSPSWVAVEICQKLPQDEPPA